MSSIGILNAMLPARVGKAAIVAVIELLIAILVCLIFLAILLLTGGRQ